MKNKKKITLIERKNGKKKESKKERKRKGKRKKKLGCKDIKK